MGAVAWPIQYAFNYPTPTDGGKRTSICSLTLSLSRSTLAKTESRFPSVPRGEQKQRSRRCRRVSLVNGLNAMINSTFRYSGGKRPLALFLCVRTWTFYMVGKLLAVGARFANLQHFLWCMASVHDCGTEWVTALLTACPGLRCIMPLANC